MADGVSRWEAKVLSQPGAGERVEEIEAALRKAKRTTSVVRWWRYRVFWPFYRALMPKRTRRIFIGHQTYTKPGKQWGPWYDRLFITKRWREWRAVDGNSEER